jgi:hypothetical protein
MVTDAHAAGAHMAGLAHQRLCQLESHVPSVFEACRAAEEAKATSGAVAERVTAVRAELLDALELQRKDLLTQLEANQAAAALAQLEADPATEAQERPESTVLEPRRWSDAVDFLARGRITALRKDVSVLHGHVEKLQTQVKRMRRDEEATRSSKQAEPAPQKQTPSEDVSELRNAVARLQQEDVAELRNTVLRLEQQAKLDHNAIARLQQEAVRLDEVVCRDRAAVEKDITGARAAIDDARTRLESHRLAVTTNKLDTQHCGRLIESHDKRIRKLEGTVGIPFKLMERLAKLEARQDAADTDRRQLLAAADSVAELLRENAYFMKTVKILREERAALVACIEKLEDKEKSRKRKADGETDAS